MTDNTLISISLPNRGQRQTWGQTKGLAQGLLAQQICAQHSGLVLFVTPDTLTAGRVEREARFFGESEILHFPDWEILAFDSFSPHHDIVSTRLRTLHQLPSCRRGLLLAPLNTLMQRLCHRTHLELHSLVLQRGDILESDAFAKRMQSNGYRHVGQVMEHGEFTIRGGIIDLYPMGSDAPFRIELFDNEVDSIRTFDPDTQCSLESINAIEMLPAHEFPFTSDAISQFRSQWREHFSGNPGNCPTYQSVSDGIVPAGIESYLPLFFDQMHTLFDYLPDNTLVVLSEGLVKAAEHYWDEVKHRHEQLRHDPERPLLTPETLMIPVNELFSLIKGYPQIEMTSEASQYKNVACEAVPDVSIEHKAENPLEKLCHIVHPLPPQAAGESLSRTLICCDSKGRREVLLELLSKANIRPTQFDSWQHFLSSDADIGITVAPLDHGTHLLELNINIIAESQLYGEQVVQRRRRQTHVQDPASIIRNLTELEIGSPVVHIQHGVGRYHGLETIETGDISAEYLRLHYAGDQKLYVPVTDLHVITRYTGLDAESAPLHQLGSKKWEQAKQKAAKRVRDVAAELLDIYARRQNSQGFCYQLNPHDYDLFASQFGFTTTDDQQRAIDEVLEDMQSTRLMDRLVCGDVGFGKTEVAMRAAFVAAMNNKQAVVLVPTTLLCEQHQQNFVDRFADWPIKTAALSRFRSTKEQNQIIKDFTAGKIDILVGTHKLLQGEVDFNNVGLLIIDEEHRFGVRQKDKIKSLRSAIDILTLTATPIPRTLNLSLAGIRDLSIIATPPARRLSVMTFVRQHQNSIIREAVLREIMRGGQSYFLHNDVKSINRVAQELSELIPEAKVAVAHGQMREQELEKIMADFYHRRFNVLVCTTIIESGIDIPSANTIIINRADRFGLAQLHQLRGRVGRSHHQAYAYLLAPDKKLMTRDAQKRLQAISELGALGAGFALATNDLEIRGAGEILGDEQSGHISEIGFNLYSELLDNAVNSLKQGKEPANLEPLHSGPEIELGISALIPEDYVNDVQLRLSLYKRITNAKDHKALKELQVELVDRFGLLPEQAKNIFKINEFKMQCKPLGVTRISIQQSYGKVEFDSPPPQVVENLLQLVQNQPEEYQFAGSDCLRFKLGEQPALKHIQQMLDTLQQRVPHEHT